MFYYYCVLAIFSLLATVTKVLYDYLKKIELSALMRKKYFILTRLL